MPAPSPIVLAPMWRRSLASVIDTTDALGALTGGLALAAGLLYAVAARSDGFTEQLERWAAPSATPVEKRAAAEDQLRWAQAGAWLVVAVQRRNHQTLGQSVMGIRRVDAADGGPVGVKSATVHHIARWLISAAMPRRSLKEKELERAERKKVVVPELADVIRAHTGNRRALLLEVLRVYGRQRPNPYARLLLESGVPLALHLACLVAFPQRQSLPDFAAGIVTAAVE